MTLLRGLDLLKILAEGAPNGLGIADVCQRGGLHRVTAHRLLSGLMREGWVEQDETRRYHLGLEAWRLGVSANRRFDLVRVGDPSLDIIERELHDTTFLLQRVGNEALCVARREGTYLLKFLVMDVGVSYPLGVGAATLAILAHLDDEETAAALKETERQLTRFPLITPSQMRKMLKETRERGFAISTGFIVPAASSVAVPIFGPDGRPVGSFSCVASPDRFAGERLGRVVGVLQEEAKKVSGKLGYGGSATRETTPKRTEARKRREKAEQ